MSSQSLEKSHYCAYTGGLHQDLLGLCHGLICEAAHFSFVSTESTSPGFAVFSLNLKLAPFL